MNQQLPDQADDPITTRTSNKTAIYVAAAIATLVATMVILHLTGVIGG